MPSTGRRGVTIFFLVFGISLVALTVALNVGWILLNLQQIALLVMGIIFFAAIITGLILNTIFLIREIRRNEKHDAFMNSVTHELKTPIASIRLYLETLKSREVSKEKQQEFYDIMLKDSDRLLGTVDEILQASRTRDRGRLLNISRLDLRDVLKDSVERIRMRYGLDRHSIRFKPSVAPAETEGDRAELQIVFTNLLDNAVKYSGANVKVTAELQERGDREFEISISDTGAGIPASDLKRIFKRFYRVPNRSTESAKGTGLGLFIVKEIINKHGGEIMAESRGEGEGSTFIVRLPRK